MKKQILSIFIALTAFLSLTAVTATAYAHWFHDGYGYVSNICRNGAMFQVVPYNYVNTNCYMPGWDVWGKRTME